MSDAVNTEKIPLNVNTEPVEVENDEHDVSRRELVMKGVVGGVCLAYAAAVGYPVYRYLNSPVEKAASVAAVKEVTLDGADTLPVGTAMVFKFGTHPALLIHHDDGSWVALDAVCTHLGCTVQFDKSQKKITCACHGGEFDAKTGKNIAGPPPKPLPMYAVKVEKGKVQVTRA